jgi:hypothetical protein
MIPKSGHQFSEKIMLQQKDGAGRRFEEKSSRSKGMEARLVLIGVLLWGGVAIGADIPKFARPDSERTPGLADPGLGVETICDKRWSTRSVRNVPAALKRRVYRGYRMANHRGACARGAAARSTIS